MGPDRSGGRSSCRASGCGDGRVEGGEERRRCGLRGLGWAGLRRRFLRFLLLLLVGLDLVGRPVGLGGPFLSTSHDALDSQFGFCLQLFYINYYYPKRHVGV